MFEKLILQFGFTISTQQNLFPVSALLFKIEFSEVGLPANNTCAVLTSESFGTHKLDVRC
jgi:hypothetical protein